MKVLNVLELDNIVASLQALKGARLQEIKATGNDLALGFYTSQRILWVWIDLNALRPNLIPWTDLPLTLGQQKSPLVLFLKAHFVDRVLRAVERDETHGRLVRFLFGKAEDGAPELEIRLFPHGRNIIARSAKKQISWDKPAPLTEHHEVSLSEDPLARAFERQVRSIEELRSQWLALRKSGKGLVKKKSSDPKVKLDNEIAKKLKAIKKVEDELTRKSDMPWREVGNWIKTHQSLNLPIEWEPFVDKKRKLAWNIEQCFTRAREVEAKILGTQKRLDLLKKDVDRLRGGLKNPASVLKSEGSKAQPLRDSSAQGRTLRLNDELTVVAGKSAADNMKLLRKARAWDLWFHLRDEPSSHAILFRNKTSKVNDADLHRIAEWFVRLQFGSKYASHSGEKVVLIITECRFVHPIKGDKLGRVTFRDERTLIHSVP